MHLLISVFSYFFVCLFLKDHQVLLVMSDCLFLGMQETTPGSHISLQNASSVCCTGMAITPSEISGHSKEIKQQVLPKLSPL